MYAKNTLGTVLIVTNDHNENRPQCIPKRSVLFLFEE